MRLAINAARRGYVNYAAADASSLTAGQNRYAMFSIISRIRDVDEPSSYTRVFRGPNQWPDWLPGFEDCVMEGFWAFGELAACIMRSLASRDPTLQMATAHAFAEPLITLRLLRYEPLPDASSRFRRTLTSVESRSCSMSASKGSRSGRLMVSGGRYMPARAPSFACSAR